MPSKYVHQVTTLALAGVGYYISSSWTGSPTEQLLSVSGVLTGIAISPDLDLADDFSNNPLWFIYGKLFKHRGISHWPVIGTATRMIYLAIIIIPVTIVLNKWHWLVAQANNGWLFTWCAGLALSDLLHIVLDYTVSKTKRTLKKAVKL